MRDFGGKQFRVGGRCRHADFTFREVAGMVTAQGKDSRHDSSCKEVIKQMSGASRARWYKIDKDRLTCLSLF